MNPANPPMDGEPSDYDLPTIDEEDALFVSLVAAALPALISVFYSDTEQGEAFRDCELCERMGEEGYIATLAISQASATIERMRNPSA